MVTGGAQEEREKSQGLAHFLISETKKRVLSLIKEKGEKQSGERDSVWDFVSFVYTYWETKESFYWAMHVGVKRVDSGV